jgi:hypothetical protein
LKVKRSVAAVVAFGALACASAAGAHAHRPTVAPPGNSGASQYLEDIPNASGAAPVPNGLALKPAPQVLPRAVRHKLDRSGTRGRQTALLAEGTAPPRGASRAEATALRRLLHRSSPSAVTALTDSLGSDNDALPMLLLAIAVIAAAIALRRRARPR